MKRLKSIVHSLSFVSTVVLLILTVSVLFIGCPGEKGVMKVGVLLPLTGDIAEPGNQALNGVKLAIEEYNAREPRISIKLIPEDSKGKPADGVSAFKKLVEVDKVRVVIGDLISGVTLAVAPIAEERQVLLLAPGASSPKVRDAGDYIFRNWAADNFDGEVMAKYVARNKGKTRAAVLYVNNEYGVGLAEAFAKTFPEEGGTIVMKEGYDQGASDFRSLATKAKGADVDCIYLPGQPRENGLLVKQLREVGVHCLLAANLSVESPDFKLGAGTAGEGIVFSTPAFDPNSGEEGIETFIASYRDAFKKDPDVVAGHGYDAGKILARAISRAGSDVARIKDELYATKDFPGVTGVTSFDDHGDVTKAMMIKVLKGDGTASVIETYMP
jgi:branched-chain amino acid transport system substrate-binding protein